MSATTINAPWTLTVTVPIPDPTVVNILVGGRSIKDGISIDLPIDNAHAIIGAIEVVMSDGSQYGGNISVANQDGGQCPFEVSNGGHIPCDLVVGEESVAANSYALSFSLAG